MCRSGVGLEVLGVPSYARVHGGSENGPDRCRAEAGAPHDGQVRGERAEAIGLF
jgi:hypothetical protein